MGHYAAEMQCDECGHIRCTCPIKPSKDLHHWVVENDFSVCTKEEFLKHHEGEWSSCMQVGFKVKYKKRSDAEIAARLQCEMAVEVARAELSRLKNICKVQRPWEEK